MDERDALGIVEGEGAPAGGHTPASGHTGGSSASDLAAGDRAVSYRAVSEAMICPFGEGIALLDTRTNLYYSLDPVGAFVWERLAGDGSERDANGSGRSAAELSRAVSGEFDVSEDMCRPDIEALLSQLESNDLVRAAS